MSRPVVASLLWGKNYRVLLALAINAKVDIAAPVLLVPQEFPALLFQSGGRFIPLQADEPAIAAARQTEIQSRASNVRSALPGILAYPQSADDRQREATANVLTRNLEGKLVQPFSIIDALDELKERENVVSVLVNEVEMAAGKSAAAWAKAHGIPSFMLAHGTNIGGAYSIVESMSADYAMVFGERGAEPYLDIGIPRERLLVTGNPAWDNMQNVISQRDSYRAQIYEQLQFEPGVPLVVFATTWNGKMTALEGDRHEETLRSFFRACARLRSTGLKFHIVVKDRPSNAEQGKRIANSVAAEEGVAHYGYAEGDMAAFVAAADVVVAYESSVAVEAMMFGVPIINLWRPHSSLIGPGFDYADGMPMVQCTNADGLAELLGTLLTDQTAYATVVANMARILPRFHVRNDGHSAERCAAEIAARIALAPVASNGVAKHPGHQRKAKATLSDLERCYAFDVGWGADFRNDTIARNIFEFMKSAHDFVTEEHVVLDISAGQARYRPFYQHANYVALDSAVGDKNWDFSHLDIIGDAIHLPVRNASVDVALNFTSLEHYPEPWTFFSEVARVLKPGGKLFLFVPHLYQEHQQPYDFYRYTQYALRDLCTRNGLTATSVEPVCSVFFTATRVISFLEDSVKALGGNKEVLTYLEQTKATLTSLSHQYDAIFAENPQARLAVSQMPMQYMLVATKPGELLTQKPPADRPGLLSQILADPFEKKPIEWDGISTEVSAPFSSRRYPVVNGVPQFMS